MAGTGFNRRPAPSQGAEKTIWKSSNECLCGSGASYGDCCEKYHKGVVPTTVETTLRARYSAYALGISEYIIGTSHPKSAEYLEYMVEAQASTKSGEKRWAKEIVKMSNDYQYLGFEISTPSKEVTEKGVMEASVTFRVLFREKDGALMTVEEAAVFLNDKGRWLYFDGDTTEPTEEISTMMKSEWPLRPMHLLRYGAASDNAPKKDEGELAPFQVVPKLRGEVISASGGLGMGSRITHIPKGRA